MGWGRGWDRSPAHCYSLLASLQSFISFPLLLRICCVVTTPCLRTHLLLLLLAALPSCCHTTHTRSHLFNTYPATPPTHDLTSSIPMLPHHPHAISPLQYLCCHISHTRSHLFNTYAATSPTLQLGDQIPMAPYHPQAVSAKIPMLPLHPHAISAIKYLCSLVAPLTSCFTYFLLLL